MVGNDRYTYQELTGFLAQVAVHAGLRTHTLIFCAAVNTPMVNINAYPKSSGFMKSIGMQDWTLDILGLTTDKLVDTIIKAFAQRSTLKAQMLPVVEQEKSKARRSVELVLDVLGS
jgi:polysaccharide pyruvyl transferase WcaK-like protein